MKRVLIISPHFVPVNAADMHRIRQSVDYYIDNGWDAEIVVVNDDYVDGNKDELLLKSISQNTIIYKVKALNKKYTSIIGLGSIAYRSMYFYYKFVNSLLKSKKYDLIFFSTTAFPVCVLGRIWKKKFSIPYVIDMQDPWRSDHYLNLPTTQRPPKFWLSYQLDSILERYSMSNVDGIISVSQSYIDVLKSRYETLKNVPVAVIPFAAYPKDIELIRNINIKNSLFRKDNNTFNITYIGRGGDDMIKSNSLILRAFKEGLEKYEIFKRIKLFFIGTSYDTSLTAPKTVFPIALEMNLQDYVVEIPKRIPYYESLKILSESDILMIPGSDNVGYTASKIYSYLWFQKPMFTVFHSSSSVNNFMKDTNAGLALQFDKEEDEVIINKIMKYIYQSLTTESIPKINWDEFQKYTAEYQTKQQCLLFNRVVNERVV